MPTRFSPPGMDSRFREELSKLSIEEMIEMLENSDMDIIPGLWKVYHHALPATETNRRLENLFWRIWSNPTLQNLVNMEILMRLVWCIDSPAGITQVPELTGWQPTIFEERVFESDVTAGWDMESAFWDEETFADQSGLDSSEGTESDDNEAYARFIKSLAKTKAEEKKPAGTMVAAVDAALTMFSGILPQNLLRAQNPILPLQHSTVQSIISSTYARFIEIMAEKNGKKKKQSAADADRESSSSPSLVSSHVSSPRPSPPSPSPSASFIPSPDLSSIRSSRGSSSPSPSPSFSPNPSLNPSSIPSSGSPSDASSSSAPSASRSPSPDQSVSPSQALTTRPQTPESDEEEFMSFEGSIESSGP
ncbi:hypothetical protein PEBR_01646 [Penicillium brasilianum]|uniref:Nitrogen regulatory protein areA GATA-like domain-containing protein n=1 Tax=Penicillium brasilianum TaxID=104259 RepID=A0A1S9S256_PENBI|nr:hypothetical protein PEBR_01646 [Penicillium brasilianum]